MRSDSHDDRAFTIPGLEPSSTEEMNAKYKETWEGGLAVSVVLC